MKIRTISKNQKKDTASSLYKVKRDVSAWEAIRGIWKSKNIANPVNWQRKIRKEWERKLV